MLLVGLAVYAPRPSPAIAAGSFEMLLAARFVQGIANAAPRVVAIAVVRDVYGGRRMAEVMSFVMMVFIVVPVLAPTRGRGVPDLRQLAPDLCGALRDRARRPGLDVAAAAGDAAGGEPGAALARLAGRGLRRRRRRTGRRWATRWRPACSSAR